jgi:20S proteasome alpha/beta subunit
MDERGIASVLLSCDRVRTLSYTARSQGVEQRRNPMFQGVAKESTRQAREGLPLKSGGMRTNCQCRRGMMMKSILIVFVVVLLLLQVVTASTTQYESVRSLNSYGNAVQLQYAQAAADKQGRLIVALQTTGTGGAVWIVSPVPQRPAHHRRTPQSPSDSSLLQAVTSPEPASVIREPSTTTTAVYLVCAGVQSDAVWLLQQLRRYGTNVAERYGSHQLHSMATVTASLKRRFWGYDEKDLWLASGYESMLLSKQLPSWGRPLGIRSILISVSDQNKPILKLIEPSGIISKVGDTDIPFVCMGKNSAAVQQELLKVKDELEHASDDEVLEKLLLTAFATALATTEDDEPLSLNLEILSPTGAIEQRTITHVKKVTE